ncbi:cation-translocating P-type ATPase [uncultured Negativibacillus sp.]|uniref:cation-translocating P-type ATPase n=1 Tax=uncultured Negativibacillus sp. TaxID=1980696 RepID=UPI0025F26ADB|nr:cation-translocating P-type ATPase [uncultured Negativibacillus sp.]
MDQMFRKTAQQVLDQFGVTKDGLTQAQVEKQRQTYGENALAEEKKKSPLVVFLEQFKDLLVIILIIAAIISAVSGNSESTIVILAVITLNAILGTVQHFKAEKSLESLKALSSPSAKVMRDGRKVEVPSKDIVPGDILMLEAGDLVVADGRIVENYSLQVNESSLTGESEGVDKISDVIDAESVALGDQKNMVFSGSLVTYGRACVVVTATGMKTEIGKIATLMNQTQQKKTPLQESMDNFSQKLAIAIIGICIVVFGLSLYREMPILDSLMFAVALAVAAIPEALSSIVTIVLAMGTQKMARENAIIKELNAVESLGSVSVICSDKTGTLTQNKMTTKQVYADFTLFDGENLDFANPAHRWLLKTAVLANDSTSVDGKEIGDPTEVALINLAHKFWVEETTYRTQHPRLAELAFDSDRKLMSTLHCLDGVYTLCTKGAMDVLLARSVNVVTSEGVRPITEEDKKKISETNTHLSENGLRVLAFAYKELPDSSCCDTLNLEDESGYTFVGLVSMIDPPREESKKAVADAKRGGIRTVMITGDHKVTATAIAKQIGIFEEGDIALSGVELDKMSDEELAEKLEHVSVYARVSPEHKIRIVDAWQKKGKIVSMTGDGVNDAPALKKANIGVAMGITGTEVSKDAAAMILTDDNFATIVKAVTNGRNVYANIKNAIKFLLSGNMSGILSVLYTSLFALPIPFEPVHLLFINLLTDSLPAIAIGMEPPREDLLNQKPRNPKESIMTKDFMLTLLVQGAIIGAFVMAAYHIGLAQSGAALASTMAFATLTLARLFHGFNCRADASIFKLGLRSNIYSILAFLAGLLLLNAVLFIPAFHGLFMIADLTAGDVGMIYLLAFLPTVIIQLYKVIKERRK